MNIQMVTKTKEKITDTNKINEVLAGKAYLVYDAHERLVPIDVTNAIAWYKELTGDNPVLVILSPQNELLAEEVPEGITVDIRKGCLRTELWLAAAEKVSVLRRWQFDIPVGDSFFCQTCLLDRPIDDRSPDDRYCQECYSFLKAEASFLDPRSRPAWMPRDNRQAQKGTQTTNNMPHHVPRIMSTLNDKISEVDIIPSQTPIVTHGKRGPRHRQIPEELIRQLAGDGKGSKAIATRLKTEHGIEVSYKTVQRVLSGQRKQL